MKIKTAYFNSSTFAITNENELHEELQLSKQQIINKIAQWISKGSGWTVESVNNHYINIIKYNPLNGSSYIKLPQELKNSAKQLINMKNEDNKCFRWCHIGHFNPQEKYPQSIKICDKEYVKNLDYRGIEFSVTVKQFNKIEKQNNITINIFGYEERQPYPIYITKEKFEKHMDRGRFLYHRRITRLQINLLRLA